MRYIDNREVFLQRNISKKFEQTPYSGWDFPIYEEYSNVGKPMFSNNIGWNDSLLGRLINHIIRKIKIKLASVVQLPRLIKRLNAEFERIHTNGLLLATYDADIKYKMEVLKVEIYAYIFELRKSIADGDDVDAIKLLAESALENLEKVDDELENKSEMIDELKKLLDFLKNYKPVKGTSPSVGATASVVSNEEFSNNFDLLVNNLSYLSKMLTQYKKIDFEGSKRDIQVKSIKNEKIISKYESFIEILKEETTPVVATSSTSKNIPKNIISKEQSHAYQAFAKLKVQFQNLDKTLKGSKDPVVSSEQLNKIIENKSSEVYKNFIIKLYIDIVKNLTDQNKTFVAPNSPLYENWNLRIDKLTTSEFSSISDKMSRLATVALMFEDKSLYNEYDFDGLDFGKNLKGYVDTMSKIKKLKVSKSNNDDNGDKDEDKFDNSEIQKYLDDNCKNIVEFEVDEKIVEELNVELKNIKVQRGFIIDGFDPIIEILRIFNQAYKIYMTAIISKRSQNFDGSAAGPSPGTRLEYDDMGGGDRGPWRNNELFDQWENAVYDIIGERKYQVIFDKSTVLRVGDEIREGKGPMLRQFMTDMLDGDKLYRGGDSSGGKGSQAKFLDKYFDEPPKDVSGEPTGGSGTVAANLSMQQEISENSKNLHILKLNSPGNVYLPGKGTFFIIEGTIISINEAAGSPGSLIQIFAHYISDNKIAFVRSFGPWKRLLEPVKIEKNELSKMIEKPKQDNGNPFNINYFNLNDFRVLQTNKEVKITYTTKENFSKSTEIVLNVKDIYKICLKQDGKEMENLDLSKDFKEFEQKFISMGVDFGFVPNAKNKIEKYTK